MSMVDLSAAENADIRAYLADADRILKRMVPMWTHSKLYDGFFPYSNGTIPYIEMGEGMVISELHAGITGTLAETPFMNTGALQLAWSVTIGHDMHHAEFLLFKDAIMYAVKEIAGRFAVMEMGLDEGSFDIPFDGEVEPVGYTMQY